MVILRVIRFSYNSFLVCNLKILKRIKNRQYNKVRIRALLCGHDIINGFIYYIAAHNECKFNESSNRMLEVI